MAAPSGGSTACDAPSSRPTTTWSPSGRKTRGCNVSAASCKLSSKLRGACVRARSVPSPHTGADGRSEVERAVRALTERRQLDGAGLANGDLLHGSLLSMCRAVAPGADRRQAPDAVGNCRGGVPPIAELLVG